MSCSSGGGGRRRAFRRRIRLATRQQTRLALLLEPVAFPLDVDDGRVVKQPVQDGRGDDLVTEDLAPAGQALVGGNQDRAPLVAARDELEEQVRPQPLQRQIADLVDDQQLGCTSSFNFSSSRFSLCARVRLAISPAAVTNVVPKPRAQARRPSATAKCVLPTPGGPSSSTLSASARKRPVASSRTTFGSIEG